MIEVLDALLLVFIFVELLYAVRITLKERQIVAEPFADTQTFWNESPDP